MILSRILLAVLSISLGLAASQPLTLVVCGGDGLRPDAKDFETRVIRFKEAGFTSVQTYIYWNKVEKTQGKLDWSIYDREVEVYRRHGLKWVPFIVMGPWYVTPDFVREDPEVTMYRCLEHGRDSLIPSIWSPRTRHHVRRHLQNFAEHYGPMGIIESVNIGITGDYGEAIYSVIGNWPGSYHSHTGYWCGDALAAADFRRHARELHPGGIEALNAAWKTRYASYDEVVPFLPSKAPSERAWQEFLAWYRGAMTEYSNWCLKTTREIFPKDPIYLCTGGDMAPEHGSDFTEQARVSAAHGAGLRITNEGSSFPMNVRYTRSVASACGHYGAYFGNEPAALVTPDGMLGRIFNAVSSGANQLFCYDGPDLIDAKTLRHGPMAAHLMHYRPVMTQQRPLRDTAVYLPNLSAQQVLSADVSREAIAKIRDLLAELRSFVDYDLVNDGLIRDGALKDKRILIVSTAQVMPAEVIASLESWVRGGGLLYLLASRPTDWDGDGRRFDALAGLTAKTEEVEGICTDGPRFPRPDLLPSIATLKDLIFTRAYTHIMPEAEPLLAMAYAPDLSVAWRRKLGAGMVYTYFGPMDLRQDESTWIASHRLPLRFLRDSLEAGIREGVLREVPPTLHLGAPDIYKVSTQAGMWILNMAHEPRSTTVGGREVTVPALSIQHP